MVDSGIWGKTILIIISAVLLLCCEEVLAKSRVPLSEEEIRQKKNDCYADIESGLWGERCKSSIIAKENCALQCLSPVCYELIYESDPLEEGEKDYTRNSEYKYCMQRVSLGESLEGIRGFFG
ncbi:uncharacterized protein LOC127261789 [Andrographis paniculata]|uniref:uncharacterized protein LOC127261789 n=1 Tax=Andrographis paniculata TaxID=175694 RepID=UPI0021E6E879|nr:uncharacterized protein LOC127261789 [Andrographis paniculata]